MKSVSNPLERERLLRIAIGKTISGKTDETPWDLMPPIVKQKHKPVVSYVPKYRPNKKSFQLG